MNKYNTVEELLYDLGLDLEDWPRLNTTQEYLDFYKDVSENGIFIYRLSEQYRRL